MFSGVRTIVAKAKLHSHYRSLHFSVGPLGAERSGQIARLGLFSTAFCFVLRRTPGVISLLRRTSFWPVFLKCTPQEVRIVTRFGLLSIKLCAGNVYRKRQKMKLFSNWELQLCGIINFHPRASLCSCFSWRFLVVVTQHFEIAVPTSFPGSLRRATMGTRLSLCHWRRAKPEMFGSLFHFRDFHGPRPSHKYPDIFWDICEDS